MSKFKKNDIAYIKNVGYGLVTYDKEKIEKVTKEGIYLVGRDEVVYDPKTGASSTGDVLGLRCDLCVSAKDIAAAKAFNKDE